MEKTPSVTVQMSQEELLRLMRERGNGWVDEFDKLRQKGAVTDIGGGVDQPGGPFRTIIGPKTVIRGLFPE